MPPAQTESANFKGGNASTLPSTGKIIDKYLQATGRATAAAGMLTRLQQGTLTVGAAKFPVEVLTKGASNRITTVHFPGGDSITGFNAQAGWLSTPGRSTHEMSAAEVDGARMETYPLFAFDPRPVFKDLHVQRQEEIDGHPAYLVSAARDNFPDVNLYFDVDSGLLVRLLRYVDTPFGLTPTQVDYADYREEDGERIPFRWAITRPGGRFTIQINRVQHDVAVDDEKFTEPVGRAH